MKVIWFVEILCLLPEQSFLLLLMGGEKMKRPTFSIGSFDTIIHFRQFDWLNRSGLVRCSR